MNRQQIEKFIRAIEVLGNSNKEWNYQELVQMYFAQYYNKDTFYSREYVIKRFKEYLYEILIKIKLDEE